MSGVTTAIVGFLLLALAFPKLIRVRSQYYAALAAIVLVILLDALAYVVAGSVEEHHSFRAVAYFFTALLQIVALVMLVSSAGGISPKELGGEMGRAFEVMRRGEGTSETIVPLSEEAYRRRADAGYAPRPPRASAVVDDEDDEPGAASLDPSAGAYPTQLNSGTTPTPRTPPGPIPLD